MNKIITFIPDCRFSVYEHKIKTGNELSVQRMIVLKNSTNQIVSYTGLEQFSYPYTGQPPKVEVRTKAELVYICGALNYIFSHNHVTKVADITSKMIFAYFDHYVNTPKAHSKEILRSQQSMDLCVRHVTNFFCNLSIVFDTNITVDELVVCEETKASRHSHRIVRRYYPRYVPKRPHSRDTALLRDMPIDAAKRLVELAMIYDPMIAFAIALQLYAGLRPGSAMNVRQADSPLSSIPGIKLSYTGSAISGMEIDLTREFLLRSDGISVGKIKRERVVRVYSGFLEELVPIYMFHQKLLAATPCEEAFRPMFIGRNGRAMTYSTYTKRVNKLLLTHLKPECENNKALQPFAQLLDSYNWAPHTLRHCFSVQLVLEGLDVAQVQYYRGDSSPESALAYLGGKHALTFCVQHAHKQAIEMLGQPNRVHQGDSK